jgi:hypothetical protein
VDLTHHRCWRRVDPRAAVKSNQKQGGQKWLSPLFSSLPAVTTTAICRTEKHTQTAIDFNFSFRYRSASLQISSLFPFSSLSWTGLL